MLYSFSLACNRQQFATVLCVMILSVLMLQSNFSFKYRVGQTQLGSFWSLITNQSNNTWENGIVRHLPYTIRGCHLSTTKGTFPFARVLLDWVVINDQKLPNWVWPTLYNAWSIILKTTAKYTFEMFIHSVMEYSFLCLLMCIIFYNNLFPWN
jgi:hypothetical protein